MLKFICDRCGVELRGSNSLIGTKDSCIAIQVIELDDNQQKVVDNIHYCNKCYAKVKTLMPKGGGDDKN